MIICVFNRVTLAAGWRMDFPGAQGRREQGDQLGGHCDHPGERKMVWNALGHFSGFTVELGNRECACVHSHVHMHPHTQAHI